MSDQISRTEVEEAQLVITRLEIIRKMYGLNRDEYFMDEGLIVRGRVPNSANRLMRTFKGDRITATRDPVNFYRETFITNE